MVCSPWVAVDWVCGTVGRVVRPSWSTVLRISGIFVLYIAIGGPCAAAIEPTTEPFAGVNARKAFADSLRTANNHDLLQLYGSTSLLAGATDVVPDEGNPAERDEHCESIRDEILRRGAPMAPLVVSALRSETEMHRPEFAGAGKYGHSIADRSGRSVGGSRAGGDGLKGGTD